MFFSVNYVLINVNKSTADCDVDGNKVPLKSEMTWHSVTAKKKTRNFETDAFNFIRAHELCCYTKRPLVSMYAS